jgi:cytochrome c peroxidase
MKGSEGHVLPVTFRTLVGSGILVLLIVISAACSGGLENTGDQGVDSPGEEEYMGWSQGELATLQSLWLGSLPPLPPDPSNADADNPRAAELGQQFFFDTRFSANGQISCATCHQPGNLFTDGLPQAQAIGTTLRHAPTIVGTAYNPWFFWDGRRDSQWAQALSPMESPVEHGGTRTQYAHLVSEDESYRAAFEAIFGPLPDFSDRDRFPDSAGPVEDPDLKAAWEAMAPADQELVNQVYAGIGKAIAAYERQIMPGPSRFDAYVEALMARDETAIKNSLSPDEVAGLRLFIGRGNCTQCHNGPLLTNNSFHSIGVPDPPGQPPDIGRFAGVQQAVANEFNCFGQYSDAQAEGCSELRFVKMWGEELMGTFKVPSLRNVAETAPYMHAGQFATLGAVLSHYNQAPAGLGPTGHTDLLPLGFTQTELDQLEAFLRTLSGPLNVEPELLAPP